MSKPRRRFRDRLGVGRLIERAKSPTPGSSNNPSRSTTPVPIPAKAPGLLQASAVQQFSRESIEGATTTDETPEQYAWTKHVHLEPFFRTEHPNKKVAEAQRELHEATEKLETTLRQYGKNHPERSEELSAISIDDVRMAMKEATNSSTQSAAAFGNFVEGIVQEREAKKKNVSGKLSMCMSKVYPLATIILGLASSTSDAAGFLPLKVAANGFSQVLSLAMNERTRSEDIVQKLETLHDYDSFMSRLRQLDVSAHILAKATDLLTAITLFLRASLIHLEDNYLKKFFNWSGEDIVDCTKTLTAASLALDQAVLHEMEIVFLRWRQEEDNKRMFELISKIEFRKRQDDIWNRRMPGVGEWILKEKSFEQWMHRDIKTLWCPGLPGAGKTFITSVVISHLQQHFREEKIQSPSTKIGFAYLYCDHANQIEQTTIGLLSSLARQLAESDVYEEPNPLFEITKKFYNKYKDRSPGHNDYQELLQDIVNCFDKVFIVIDALDECAEVDEHRISTRHNLVQRLDSLPVQLMVTSRDYISIGELLRTADRIDIRPDIEDIKSYVHWRIFDETYGSPRLRELINRDDSLEHEITMTVVERYSRIFNLARLQMDHIQLSESIGDIRDELKSLVMSESDFYGIALERMRRESSKRGKAKPSYNFRILVWILHARRPLHIEEIKDVIAVRPLNYSVDDHQKRKYNERVLLDSCAGLVILEPESKLMKFAHPTVNEYLRTISFPDQFKFDVNFELSQTCLTYLFYDAFDGPCNDEEAFSERIKQYSFLPYAALNWGFHLPGEPNESLNNLVLSYLRTKRKLACSIQVHDAFDKSYWSLRVPGSSQAPDALRAASKFGLKDIVQIFLDQGIDARAKYYNGRTALMEAAIYGHKAVIELLLKHKADIESKDNDGRTALIFAAIKGDKAMVEFLLIHQADIESKDNNGWTALTIAAAIGQEFIVQVLLEYGADIEVKDNAGTTALKKAAIYGQDTIVQMLLKHKEEVKALSKEG